MDNNKKQKLILASCSPRRRELIKLLGMDFECISVDADESTNEIIPSKAVQEISAKKARAALSARKIARDEVIIGADTIVVFNEKLLGKPLDDDDAERMLLMLSGQTHFVYTGVTLIYRDYNDNLTEISFAEKTEVTFAEISLEEIRKYISGGNHRDKAGSYAIQDEFGVHITGIKGDYNNVVGFPVARIYSELKKIF